MRHVAAAQVKVNIMDLASMMGFAAPGDSAREEAHDAEVRQLRDQMREKSSNFFYQQAFKRAAADVLNEIVDELKLEEAGKLEKRVMTDPANADLRNEVYAEAAAEHVNRISGGRVRMSRASMDRLKKARTFK
jgi:hypothetical protein